MLESPFRFEPVLSADDFQAIGRLALKWSHIDHIIGNCLKVILRLSDEEAIIVVFPLSSEFRLNKIKELSKLKPLDQRAQEAFDALAPLMKALQFVRNNVIHAIATEDGAGGYHFHLRSKNRNLTKAEILSTEEITNYTAHAVYALRYALGVPGFETVHYPLPDRPQIPEFLLKQFPELQAQKKATQTSQPPSSPG